MSLQQFVTAARDACPPPKLAICAGLAEQHCTLFSACSKAQAAAASISQPQSVRQLSCRLLSHSACQTLQGDSSAHYISGSCCLIVVFFFSARLTKSTERVLVSCRWAWLRGSHPMLVLVAVLHVGLSPLCKSVA